MIGKDLANLYRLLNKADKTEEWAYLSSEGDQATYAEKMNRYYEDIGTLVRRIYNELRLG